MSHAALLPPPRDDTEACLRDLEGGRRLSFLVAPAALKRIDGFSGLLGFLRERGAVSFHEVLPYADVSTWLYWLRLAEDPSRPIAVTACAGAAAAARKLSRAPSGIPSPLQASAMILGKNMLVRHGSDAPEAFAFISPCAYKWTEFDALAPGGIPIEYNVTIRRLNSLLDGGAIHASGYTRLRARRAWKPLTVGAFGSVLGALRAVMPALEGKVVYGIGPVVEAIKTGEDAARALFEPYSCASGCEKGSAVGASPSWIRSSTGARTKAPPTREEVLARFESFERRLDPATLSVT